MADRDFTVAPAAPPFTSIFASPGWIENQAPAHLCLAQFLNGIGQPAGTALATTGNCAQQDTFIADPIPTQTPNTYMLHPTDTLTGWCLKARSAEQTIGSEACSPVPTQIWYDQTIQVTGVPSTYRQIRSLSNPGYCLAISAENPILTYCDAGGTATYWQAKTTANPPTTTTTTAAPTTTAPPTTTTAPVATTTTTVPPPTTTTTLPAPVLPTTTTTIYTPPTRPTAFTQIPNYLRSQKTGLCLELSTAANGTCGPENGLVFQPTVNGRVNIKSGTGSTCLAVTPDRYAGAYWPDPSKPAGIVRWIDCNFPFYNNVLLDTDWLPELIDPADNWYILRPRQNAEGMPDPCLNLNTNPTAIGATLLEYKCQYTPQATEERWAPAERDWTPNGGGGGPTTTLPPPPSGAHPLDDGVPTPLERKLDLACLTLRSDGHYIIDGSRSDCEAFIPTLVAGGFRLNPASAPNACLGFSGFAIVRTSCTNDTVWIDGTADSDGAFPLYIRIGSTSYCLGGNSEASLIPCSAEPPPSLKWYDAKVLRKAPRSTYDVCAEYWHEFAGADCNDAQKSYYAWLDTEEAWHAQWVDLASTSFRTGINYWYPRYKFSPCRGRLACTLAYAHYYGTGNLGEAKRIAFEYCITHEEECVNDSRWDAVGQFFYEYLSTLITYKIASIQTTGNYLIAEAANTPVDYSPTYVGRMSPGRSDLSRATQLERYIRNDVSGRNYAAFEFQNPVSGQLEIKVFRSQNGTVAIGGNNYAAHSENVGFKYFSDNNISYNQITRVYSERQPCTYGFAQCQQNLFRLSPQAKVTYSFYYGGSRTFNGLSNAKLQMAVANLQSQDLAVNGIAR